MRAADKPSIHVYTIASVSQVIIITAIEIIVNYSKISGRKIA